MKSADYFSRNPAALTDTDTQAYKQDPQLPLAEAMDTGFLACTVPHHLNMGSLHGFVCDLAPSLYLQESHRA